MLSRFFSYFDNDTTSEIFVITPAESLSLIGKLIIGSAIIGGTVLIVIILIVIALIIRSRRKTKR